MTRAAIYLRISADREGRELGVQRQEEDCRRLAKRLKLSVAGVYSDNDISASRRSTKRRPGYEELLAEVRAGRLDVVLAYSTSRLTRRPREFEDWIDLAEAGAVRISTVAAGDVDLTTAAGRFYARMLAARDSNEAEEMSERARRERQQRREDGRWHGGARPFGFEADGVTTRPAEQALIVKGAHDLLGGRSLQAIARDWNAAGMPTPAWRGVPWAVKPWRSSSVRDILANPRVAGMLPGGQRSTQWEPLVDEATWRGVVALLGDPSRHTGGGPFPNRLLTGIAYCGVCAAEGVEATVNGGITRRHVPTYRCSRRRHLDRVGAPVDDLVREVVCRFIAHYRVEARPAAPEEGTASLAARAAGVRAQLDEVADMLADRELTRAQAARATARLTEELEGLEAAMTASASRSVLEALPGAGSGDLEAVTAIWDGADYDQRRAILRASPVRITLLAPGRGSHIFRPETVVFERLG